MSDINRVKIGNKVNATTLIINLLLSVIKIIAGFISGSSAMIADGFHSASDVLSTIGVMISLTISSKPADESHPYGHERMEPIFSNILATILLLTALGIGYSGIQLILSGNFIIPGRLAIYAAIFSILTKEWMYHYTMRCAKRIDSSSMMVDAWHHRTDAFSSIGTLVGILGARLGFPILDPIASILICILIIKVAVDIYLQAINQLVDKSACNDTLKTITDITLSVEGVLGIDEIKTRMYANKYYVDLDICVDGNISVSRGHDIAHEVHDKIEASDLKIKHCMVHVNPHK